MTSIEQAVSSPARQSLVVIVALIGACTSTTVSAPEPSPSRLETLVPGSAMHGVHGLAFDADDNLYGASLTGYSVYQIDTQSGEVTVAVEPPLGNSDDVAVWRIPLHGFGAQRTR